MIAANLSVGENMNKGTSTWSLGVLAPFILGMATSPATGAKNDLTITLNGSAYTCNPTGEGRVTANPPKAWTYCRCDSDHGYYIISLVSREYPGGLPTVLVTDQNRAFSSISECEEAALKTPFCHGG